MKICFCFERHLMGGILYTDFVEINIYKFVNRIKTVNIVSNEKNSDLGLSGYGVW